MPLPVLRFVQEGPHRLGVQSVDAAHLFREGCILVERRLVAQRLDAAVSGQRVDVLKIHLHGGLSVLGQGSERLEDRLHLRFGQACEIHAQVGIPGLEVPGQQRVRHPAEELAVLVLAGHVFIPCSGESG